MAGLGPRAAVTLPAAAALALLLSFFLLKRRRSRSSNSDCCSLSETTACLLDDREDEDADIQSVPPASSSSSDQSLRSSPTAPTPDSSPPRESPSSPDMRLRDGSKAGDAKLKGSNSHPKVLTVEIPEQPPVQRPADDESTAVVERDALCGASPSGSVDSLLGHSSPSPPSSTVSPARRESGSEPTSSLARDVAALSLAEQPATADAASATSASENSTQREAAVDEVIVSAVATTTMTAAPDEPATRQDDAASPSADVAQNEESVSEDKSQAQALSFSDAHSEVSGGSPAVSLFPFSFNDFTVVFVALW
ncbi:hypothetical protein HPB50_024617 [Hyalomma asiaticum]|uniref:Uncharacterized protein n=1 Tax=Hyalomma asiaticum TaxID=266040 RepID=A0ACB7SIM6_HYAAI|nr:hypothetical protein HPB50_024617 [Hyalomma asiaticum]